VDTPNFCTSRRFAVDHLYLSFRITISTNKKAITTKEANIMALYMTQFAYTAEAWASLVKNPQDRSVQIRELAQQMGGRLVGLYYCFGEYDGVVLAEAPDDTTALAEAMAAVTPGHVKAIKTTKLFTVEETMEAMRKAGSLTFQGPSKG
jgi:uncharacterized protein with GYD domain